MEKFSKEIIDRCFDISNNLLAVLNKNFSGEFISLNDFLKINGKFNNEFFYTCDDEDNLDEFNIRLDCGYVDESFDKCSDQLYVSLSKDCGVVYYDRFCLYEGNTPIHELNEVNITRRNDSVILSFSKVISDGYCDYEECNNHFVDVIEIEDCETESLLDVFARKVDQNKILK